jgi:hypothetical protein
MINLIILFLLTCLGLKFNVGLSLSINKKKLGKDNEIIGTLEIKDSNKVVYNHNQEIEDIKKNPEFELKECIFGTNIINKKKCLTYSKEDFSLEDCCTEDEFCIIKQSFSITKLDIVEDSKDEEDKKYLKYNEYKKYSKDEENKKKVNDNLFLDSDRKTVPFVPEEKVEPEIHKKLKLNQKDLNIEDGLERILLKKFD